MKISFTPTLQALGGLLLVVFAGGGAYYYETALVHPAPCAKPLQYYVGTYDDRFGISRADYEKALTQAADIWNTAAGRRVLVAGDSGTLPVNLVYDDRQKAVGLGAAIGAEQSSYDAKKSRVDELKKAYDLAKETYAADQSAFQKANADYTAKVDYWNARGGAPASEYQSLAAMREDLATRQTKLNEEANNLNAAAAQINQSVATLNASAQETNAKVNAYNADAGNDFNEGEYIRDADGTRINIYEFQTYGQLVRALAHEFGHSLGLAHDTDPASIMYPYNKGSTTVLSAQDLAELKVACKLQ